MSIGKKPCPGCGGPMHRGSVRCSGCVYRPDVVSVSVPIALTPTEQVARDQEKRQNVSEVLTLRAKYKAALEQIDTLTGELRTLNILEQGTNVYAIEPRHGKGTSEGTAVVVLSDWHIEETVGAEIGGLNTYTLEGAKVRAVMCFQSALRLIKLLQQDIAIPNIVLALLGDFITNAELHNGDNAEACSLPPTLALIEAQNLLLSGIDFLLANTDATFTIVCHSGNHARTTNKTRFNAENGHSLEYLMYTTLAKVYRDEKRITFIIPEGMHSYVQVYDTTIRFHHGHAVKYGGGVGGIYIPVNKAIAQWSKARHADLDVFGHFHQMRDGGNFLCNGSLIGYNAFALSIKADFEQPKQTLFLIDKKRGRTCTWPILVGS